jgi:arylsulfatase A-like enzyme
MKKPNVILINCDDMGYGDLGCYGSSVNKTPAIDKLAREGTRFTDFYMVSPVCSPSRGGMLTGCYPPRISFGSFEGATVLFPGHGVGLHPDETTIADMLREQGYHTKIIGKWHCGDQPEFLPLNYGFDEYYGLPYSNDMGRQAGRKNQMPPLPLIRDSEVIQQQPDQRALTERYVEQALEFITNHRDDPVFLYFAHLHVPLPLYAAERVVQEADNGDSGACMASVDWSVQCLMHKLDEEGLADDTMIIFTSDNGSRGDNGGSNAPLRGAKTTTWEGGMRVPCIMRWNGHIPANRVCSDIVASIDFLPTFAALCGANLPKAKIDGLDLSALFLGNTKSKGREIFFYYKQNNLEAVRCGDWKLHIRKDNEKVQLLYNLCEDISEQNNLYNSYPDVIAQLENLIDKCRSELGDEAEGIQGTEIRSIGRVENAKPLTDYDENHPYIVAMYDKPEAG